MNRFFVDRQQLSRDGFVISGSDVRHMGKVLRLRPGDRLIIVTPEGKEWEARLDKLDNQLAIGTLLKDISVDREAGLAITLIQGLPKAGKMDEIIQDGTEVGLVRFVPLVTARSMVRLEGDQGKKKVDRWRKIAAESAKQARRTVIPEVTMPATWETIWKDADPESLDILLWEDECRESLQKIWMETGPWKRIRLIVGPEGGFSPDEAARAVAAGARTVSLGPRVLRTETAGLVAASALLYASGDLGGAE